MLVKVRVYFTTLWCLPCLVGTKYGFGNALQCLVASSPSRNLVVETTLSSIVLWFDGKAWVFNGIAYLVSF